MIVLKRKAARKVIVDSEGQLHAYSAGNTLPVDETYCHVSGISIQRMETRRQAYCCTNVMSKIFSTFQNYNLHKNKVVIDSNFDGKINRTLAYNIIRDIYNNSEKKNAPANINIIIDSLPADTVKEPTIPVMKCVIRL